MRPFVLGLAVALLVLLGAYWLRSTRRTQWSSRLGWLAVLLGVVVSMVLAFRGRPEGVVALLLLGLPLWRRGSLVWRRSRAWLRERRPTASNGEVQEWCESRVAGTMSSGEALAILGLERGASGDEVRRAHRRLIQKFHPDQGGSSHLAARINRARDVLLGDRVP